MSSAARLTSRNLFDTVFSTIPADVVLDTGPETLREKCARMASGRTAAAAAVEDNDNNGESGVGTATVAAEGFFLESSGAPMSNTGVIDVSAMMRRAAEATEMEEVAAPPGDGSLRHVFDLQLDADDEAVREATKYAALLVANEEGEAEETAKAEYRNKGKGAGVGNNREASRAGHSSQRQKQQQRDMADASRRLALTAEEQMAIMRPEEGIRHEGRCVLFRHCKGFGFIAPEVGGPDVYFTRDNVEYFFTRRVLEAYYCGNLPAVLKPKDASRGTGGGDRRANRATASVLGASSDTTTTSASASHNTTSQSAAEEAGKAKTEANTKGTTEVGDAGDRHNAENKPNDTKSTTSKAVDDGDARTQSLVQQAAALLTPEAARLLLLFLQVGKPIVSMSETVTFTTRWNRAGNQASRRLRADELRGLPANGYALMVEQAWFERLFPRASGRRTEERGRGTTSGGTDECLARRCGTIRMYDADELRGVIRSEEDDMSGVLFYSDAFLWDPSMDPARCRPSVGLIVRYSVAGRDRYGKEVASLITTTDDSAISEANAEWATDRGAEDHERRKQGRSGNVLGSGSGSGAGGGGSTREAETAGRKRRRDEELLLLEEDDYGFM
ncbi:hypothetical protein TraAM80_02267 [Trypanosoma rangeli]|uniref:CSD domain-containing protein n=1 Tax=Trypanosoma rangeli TaxID=5698 RepID=A0A3R7M5B6_TRYRA|nr:uncharacterized protein TraAM80_02267 [Trypanosoma rangeli]RNF09320.1 hypothetical protein TraAM80_02267 [Trypanosoma rangeli]|eukprot:RNF09320.1 hypothetical protein TraAM80_02267 [Trypanosoma rangeli]